MIKKVFTAITLLLICIIIASLFHITCVKRVGTQGSFLLPNELVQNLFRRDEVIEKTKEPKEPLQLELLGSLIGTREAPLVCIKDIVSGYEGLYKVGDRIKDSVITGIRHGQVELLRHDGTKEILQIAEFTDESLTLNSIISGYKTPNNILKEIALRPEVSAGKLCGFRLTKLQEDSLIQRIGFKKGDIITQINGYPVNSITHAKRLYDQMRNEYNKGLIEDIEIEYERDGKVWNRNLSNKR